MSSCLKLVTLIFAIGFLSGCGDKVVRMNDYKDIDYSYHPHANSDLENSTYEMILDDVSTIKKKEKLALKLDDNLDSELNVFNNNKSYSILHLAPEWRLSEKFLKYKYKQYICSDKFMPGYHYPKHTIDMDIMDIKFNENTFDLVLCNHVLEHIPDDIAAMKELYRVLKPNGTAILQVPISSTLMKTFEDTNIKTDEEREEIYGQ